MCGRYRLSRKDQWAQYFEVNPFDDFEPRYNIAPTQNVPVVREGAKGREVAIMRWGLIPSWAKDSSMSSSLINARGETVTEKPAFSDSFVMRRCLIPADGFYEWKRTGKAKQPYHFGMRDESVFAFAGIWDRWLNPAGKIVESCSILTTQANALLSDVHNRMPVILPRSEFRHWLSARQADVESLTKLLVPLDAGQMRRHPVSTLVNRPENDSAECAKEVAAAPENLELWS
jgi:putative SOS response-associated peptidase YedK